MDEPAPWPLTRVSFDPTGPQGPQVAPRAHPESPILCTPRFVSRHGERGSSAASTCRPAKGRSWPTTDSFQCGWILTGEPRWCGRDASILPEHAIANIPFPESGHRFADVVLHDSAAVGEREMRGKTVPVFNALALLEAAEYQTFVLWAPNATPNAIQSLASFAEEEDYEDWSSSVRYICAQCSQGPALPEHDHHELESGQTVQPAVAARTLTEALRLAQRWTERERVGPVSVRLLSEPGR